MPTEPTEAEAMTERLNFYLPPSLRERLRRIAAIRRTNEATTLRWVLEHGIDWFEELSKDEQEAV